MWFFQAISSAVLGAIEIVLNKKVLKNVSATVLTWSLFSLSLPLIMYVAFKGNLPTINPLFLIGVIGSAVAFVISKTLINKTIKNSVVSQIFPLTMVYLFIY